MTDFLPTNQLDFNELRSNLKSFLQAQSIFKDYDFEGSNISVLLDILAYNSYQNAFYLNMVGNEMFLDTALLRDSVVSHAKELNYLPRSYTSASATVNVLVNVTDITINNINLPQYFKFNSVTSNGSFTFSTDNPTIITRNSNNQFTANINILEGFIVTENFIVNTNIDSQRFVLSNEKVDTDSIQVFIQPSVSDANTSEYVYKTTLLDINPSSNVYFIQSAETNKYEIIFGDGIVGNKPKNNNLITVNYRISSGNLVNGASNFTAVSTLDGYTVTATTIEKALGGAEAETIASIKFNAPRHFQTQDRVITQDDYRTLLLANFPQIKTISVFGGEEYPVIPQYGRVFISASTFTGYPVTEETSARIINYLKGRSTLSIQPTIIDPEYLDIQINTSVNFNTNNTSYTNQQIKNIIETTINTFNQENLLEFNKTFRYSKFVAALNDAHPSIVSNETSTLMVKTFIPLLNETYSVIIDFGNTIRKDEYNVSRSLTNEFVLYSSQITYNNKQSYIGEDGNGLLFIYEFTNTGRNILNNNIGTINYDTGVIVISNIIFNDFFGAGISLFATPINQDIKSVRNTIIRIDPDLNNITVNAIQE